MVGSLCPSSTHLSFQVKSIFISQTRGPVTFFQPGGTPCTSSRISNDIPTSVISLDRDSFQKVLLFLSSIASASVTLVGIYVPYFFVVFIILDFTLDRITLLLRNVYGTHHAKEGLSDIPRAF